MIKPECLLGGSNFQPSKLDKINNIELRVIGEPEEFKKNKDKLIPYEACYVCTPDSIPNHKRITWMAEFIKENKNKFINAGATDITFWIYWYGVQGNMEFTSHELSKISELNIPLCIDYIFQDKEE